MMTPLPAVLGLLVLGSVTVDKIRCSPSECKSPFPHYDKISGACQAVERMSLAYDGTKDNWDHNKFKISSDSLVRVTCNEDGNYPAHDCRHFYHCVSGQAKLKTCTSPAYPYFDPVLERCSNNPTCPAIDCFNNFRNRAGLEGTLSPFFGYCFNVESDSEYLGIGVINKLTPFLITRCYGNDLFNPNTGRCEPYCLQEGVIPDTTDCRRYILCTLDDPLNVGFSLTYHRCPSGQAFQQKEYRCAPEDEVKFCSLKRVWPL